MTTTQLQILLKSSAVAAINQPLLDKPLKKVKQPKKLCKYKSYIEQVLTEYCNKNGYKLLREHRFHEARKFRFDWAIKELMLVFEYNGIFSTKSRHTTVGGYSKDREKVNLATSLGWKVYEYTPINYRDIDNQLK